MIVDEELGIVREPHLIISSDRTEFQSFDGLPSHRRNVFPVNLEPIIEHCSVFPRLLNIVPPPSDLEHHHLQQERVILDGTIIIILLCLCLFVFNDI